MAFPTGYYLTATTPGKTAWGLDTLRRSYKTQLAADDALSDLNSPAKYTADLVHGNMWLMDKTVVESGPQASQLDLVYNGILNGSVLPPARRKNTYSIQTAQTQSGGVPISLTYGAPGLQTDWVSDQSLSMQFATGFPTASSPTSYKIPGTVLISNDGLSLGGVGTGFTSVVDVGDIVFVLVNIVYPSALPGDVATYFGNAPFKVISVDSDLALTVQPMSNINFAGIKTYYLNRSYGVHPSANAVQAISIRWGCGLSGTFNTGNVSSWALILVNTSFIAVNAVQTESTEVVPGKFWQNTQRTTLQLLPISC